MAKHKKIKRNYSTGIGKKLVKKFWGKMDNAIIIIISAAGGGVWYFSSRSGEHYKEYIPYFTSKSFYQVEIKLFKANFIN